MSTTKNKSLVIAVVILLLTNIAMLVFILMHQPPDKKDFRNREAMMTDFLQKDIGFSKEQMVQYDTLNSRNKEKMKMKFDEMRSGKENIYKELGKDGFTDSAITKAAQQLSSAQQGIEENMMNHLATIRKICTPEQQSKFDTLFYKIWNKMGDRKKKPNQ